MTELTDAERDTLRGLCWIDSAVDPPEWAGFLNDVLPAVEAILTARLARITDVHWRYFDEEGEPGFDDTTPEPEDAWRYDRDFRAALAVPTPDEVQNPDPFCTGAGDCTYPVHVHGCFADRDGSTCDDPGDHVVSGDAETLSARIRREALIADRPGQLDRLEQIAEDLAAHDAAIRAEGEWHPDGPEAQATLEQIQAEEEEEEA